MKQTSNKSSSSSPNGKTKIPEDPIVAPPNAKDLKEILHEGQVYDVTNWIHRHPGGSIINEFIGRGKDGTQAIQQFHQGAKARERVSGILASLNKRPAKESDYGNKGRKLERYHSMTTEFVKLYAKVEAEGLFKASYSHIFLRLLELFVLGYLGASLLLSKRLAVRLVGVLPWTLVQIRCFRLQTELGHSAFTTIPKVDQFLQTVFMGIGFGLSATWWNLGHNYESHTHAQRTLLLSTPPHRLTLYYLATQALVDTEDRFSQVPNFLIKNRLYWEGLCVVAHHVIGLYFGFFIPLLLSTYFLLSNRMFHAGFRHVCEARALPNANLKYTHWIEDGFQCNANMECWLGVDWLFGELTHNVEHSLFPSMPRFRYGLIEGRVKALAKRFRLPYHSVTCAEAFKKFALGSQEYGFEEAFEEDEAD